MLKTGHTINAWMALTNLAVLPALLTQNDKKLVWMASMAALGSFLMHLTETKHNLPGFYPSYSKLFLNLDRLIALAVGTYVSLSYYTRLDLLAIGIPGLICMMISESPFTPQRVYVLCHTLWHCSVYTIFYLI